MRSGTIVEVSDQYIANRFRVLQELGHGGMGTVYRVADTLGDDRVVALKTFRSDLPITPERKLRFREEFRAMARLRHPNTIEVYDYGSTDELGFKAAENPAYSYELHATALHLLGLDHEKLSFYHNGIQRRLTDVHGHVIKEIIT